MKVKASNIILGVIVFIIASSVISGIFAANKPTDEAINATFKNSFISGCTKEGAEYSVCGCAYKELEQMYPDFATNEGRLNRILEYGYSQQETDKIVYSCVNTEEV